MKVSIITATFNSAATIADTLESVLSQTYADIEYIVVDGDSRDNTMNIVNSYAPKFEGRMKIVSEKDNGIYDAMNKGIRMATGDIVGVSARSRCRLRRRAFHTRQTPQRGCEILQFAPLSLLHAPLRLYARPPVALRSPRSV